MRERDDLRTHQRASLYYIACRLNEGIRIMTSCASASVAMLIISYSQMLPRGKDTSYQSNTDTKHKSNRYHGLEQIMLAHKCKQRCDNLKSSGNICQYLIIHVVQKDQRYSRTDRTYDHTLYDERRPYV